MRFNLDRHINYRNSRCLAPLEMLIFLDDYLALWTVTEINMVIGAAFRNKLLQSN